MDPRFAEISTVLSDYFDGLYNSDISRCSMVFHPMAHYVSSLKGALSSKKG